MDELFNTDPSDTAAYQGAVLRKLAEAGPNGLALTKLVGKKASARAAQQRVLKEMEKAGAVKVERKGSLTRYWLPGQMPPQVTPEEKADEVLRRVLPEQRRERLLTLARIRDELLKGLGIKEPAIRTCLRVLEQEGLVVKLTEGTRDFYAYVPALKSLLGEALVEAPPPVVKTPEPAVIKPARSSDAPLPVTNQRVIEAYRSVRMQRRLPDVEIARLQEVLHCTVEELKPVVQRLCEQGTFIPGKGDWSFASTASRAAAVLIQGEPHLFVRMKD